MERLRASFIGLSLVATAVVMARVLESDAPLPIRGLAMLGLLAMVASWLACYRRHRVHAATLLVDVAAVLAIGAALGGPVTIAGYLFVSLALRASYQRSFRGVLWPTAVYAAVLLGGQLLGPLYGGATANDPRISQVPGILAVGFAMRLLVSALERQQQALLDERALSAAGSALVEAVDRGTIVAAGVQAARALVGGERGVSIVREPGQGPPRLTLPLQAHHGLHGYLRIEGETALAEHSQQPLEALCTLIALRLEVDSQASRERSAMETQAAELAELNRFKDELMDKVSHELRTPLTSIRSFSELLFNYDDPAVQSEFLHIINNESVRLTRLLDDMLDLSKIQSGMLEWHMEQLDVAGVLNEVARIHRPLLEHDSLDFEVEVSSDLPPVQGDADRLMQVTSNLIGNARKFTVKGSISLSARSEGEQVRVAVADTGIGVPPADRNRIFEQFRQASPAPTGRPRGTGLGLSICREVIQHHGGRIWVEERPGGGSIFQFTLPALESAA